MKPLLVFYLCICFYSNSFAQQGDQSSGQVSQENVIIGVITEDPGDFYKVTDLLKSTKGVNFNNYCFDQKLVSFSFSKGNFAELNEVFFLIESHFAGAQCFRMGMSAKSYFDICDSEIIKQVK